MLTVLATCRFKVSLNQINAGAISAQKVQSVLGFNVKQLHSVYFLNLPPSLLLLLLFMLSASSLSALSEDLG